VSVVLRALFDGLCEPKNPGGVACYGFVVYRRSGTSEVKVFEGHGLAAEPGPDSTHNLAEYTGLIKALEWVQANLEDRDIEIFGDSQLVIRHMTGEYSVRSPRIIPLYERACSLLERFSWTAKWIPREQNRVADELSMKAYREYCLKKYGKVPPTMRQTGAIY
jgi:ribonuclease HI